jgi:hypothetical protein
VIEPSALVSAPAAGSPVDRASRIARKVVEDRMISTVDPQTRPTPKSTSVRKDGYRGHVTAEPETGLITDCEMTKAAGQTGSDSVVGEQMISRDRYHHADAHRWPAEHNEPARPERAHQPPGDDQPADQQNALAGGRFPRSGDRRGQRGHRRKHRARRPAA